MICGEQALDMFKSLLKINAVKVTYHVILESETKVYLDFTLLQRPAEENINGRSKLTNLFIRDQLHVDLLHGGWRGQSCGRR